MTDWVETGGTGFAYADWEAGQAGEAADGQTVPVFLSLGMPEATGADAARTAARSRAIALRQAGLRIPPHEADRLLTEFLAVLDAGLLADWRFRLVAYARRGDIPAILAALPFVTLLHVGPPLPPDAASGLPDPDPRPRLPRGDALQKPITCVIDDGIPFLNARFRRELDETRFLAVWLQSDKATAEPGAPEIGMILETAQIDALIARDDEAGTYHATNARLVPVTERASTNFRVSHGAHVLDIAAGADFRHAAMPEDDLRLLAVQLPSISLADTSGRLNGRFVVQGLRWSIMRALEANAPHGAGALVVNLSLGSLAGPGDATAFLASWLDYECAAYRLMARCDLRITCAYGNAHRQKLAGRARVTPDAPMAFDWVTLPEDFTPSFLELRVEEDLAGTLSVTLTPPHCGPPPVTMTWAEAAQGWTWDGPDGLPWAAILRLDEVPGDDRTTALLIATARTGHPRGLPAAASGAWKVEVSGGPALVTADVQRDDTPAGYRINGRQSWLDGPNGYDWDENTRDWIRPAEPYGLPAGAAGPVTRQGTAVAHAGASAPTVNFVAANKTVIGFPDRRAAALYSASGLPVDAEIGGAAAARPGESAMPDLGAMASDGSNLFGRYASGVVSGAIARLAGTSVAAPALARAWARAYAVQAGPTAPPLPQADIPISDLTEPSQTDVPERIMGEARLKGQKPYTRGSVLF
ncbi:hypothetical protein HKCCE3408_19185 [Rhodobacterales bacterium HKCCE3408]|nr:hypothetical protein [Rhodobacterales bacterium HKCCE3408]